MNPKLLFILPEANKIMDIFITKPSIRNLYKCIKYEFLFPAKITSKATVRGYGNKIRGILGRIEGLRKKDCEAKFMLTTPLLLMLTFHHV